MRASLAEHKGIQVKEYNKLNRAFVATTQFKQGECILKLQPLVLCILDWARSSYCNRCLKADCELSCCSACQKTRFYCSKQCQKLDWKLHKQECKAIRKINEKGQNANFMILLVLRAFLALKEHGQTLEDMLLLDHIYSPEEQKMHLSIGVSVLWALQIDKTEQLLTTLNHLQKRIKLNCFTVMDCQFDKQLAVGIYYPANFINHECDPNALQLFNGQTLHIVACKDIQPGEQIFISYVERADSLADRQQQLQQYKFKCNCTRCLAEKICGTSLLCPTGCGGTLKQGVFFIEQLQKEQEQKDYHCTSCKNKVKQEQFEQMHKNLEKLKAQILNEATPYKQKLALAKRLNNLMQFEDPSFRPVLQQLYITELNKGIANSCRFEEAYVLSKMLVSAFKKWYRHGPDRWFEPAILWRQLEQAMMSKHLGKSAKKRLRLLEEAERVARTWLEGSPRLRSLLQMKQETETLLRLHNMKK